MSSPLVSIIIPCRNGEGFVDAAISSALAQTYARTEIIVIDDGSTDGSLDVIRSFGDRVRWESGPNQGACRARNRGLALARGEVVQFLDADDRLHPTKIAAQLDVMHQSGADSIYCDAWAHKMSDPASGGKIRRHAQNDDSIIAALGSNAGTTAGLHRREIVESAGGFDESLPCAQERDLHLRLACLGGKAATLPQVLVEGAAQIGQALVVDRVECDLALREFVAAGRTTHAASANCTRPRKLLVSASVISTGTIWPISRAGASKFTMRLFSVRPHN